MVIVGGSRVTLLKSNINKKKKRDPKSDLNSNLENKATSSVYLGVKSSERFSERGKIL